MDCEHFDTALVGALYGEIDELTGAAMTRHREGCRRCEAAWSELSAVHELAVLPLEEPSDGLEARILASAVAAQRAAPWPRRAFRTLAWAGSQAMRPQLAAAAVLLLILGSSVMLLRPKPGSVGTLPVRVTERGAPASEPTPAIGGDGDRPPESAKERVAAAPRAPSAASPRAEGAATADERAKAGAPASGPPGAAGCSAAVAALDELRRDAPNAPATAEAVWQAAECYRAQGNAAQAAALYSALLETPSHAARATERLRTQQEPSAAAAAKARAGAKPAKAGAAAKPSSTE